MDESGRGSWQGLCSGWPRVATAEGEGSSAAKGNSGCGPDKLNPSSDLQGESRLRKMRGEVKGQGDPAGGQECTCKPRPRERVQGHIDEWRRDIENAFFSILGRSRGLMRAGRHSDASSELQPINYPLFPQYTNSNSFLQTINMRSLFTYKQNKQKTSLSTLSPLQRTPPSLSSANSRHIS